jgi:hypothetical protein
MSSTLAAARQAHAAIHPTSLRLKIIGRYTTEPTSPTSCRGHSVSVAPARNVASANSTKPASCGEGRGLKPPGATGLPGASAFPKLPAVIGPSPGRASHDGRGNIPETLSGCYGLKAASRARTCPARSAGLVHSCRDAGWRHWPPAASLRAAGRQRGEFDVDLSQFLGGGDGVEVGELVE